MKFFVDIKRITHGQRFPVPLIRALASKNVSHVRDEFVLMSFRDYLIKVSNATMAAKIDHGEVVVLCPEEASQYAWRMGRHARRKQHRSFRLQVGVDSSQMTQQQRQEHEQRLILQSLFTESLRATSAKIPTVIRSVVQEVVTQ